MGGAFLSTSQFAATLPAWRPKKSRRIERRAAHACSPWPLVCWPQAGQARGCWKSGCDGTTPLLQAISGLLAEHLDPDATLLFVSHCNERQRVGATHAPASGPAHAPSFCVLGVSVSVSQHRAGHLRGSWDLTPRTPLACRCALCRQTFEGIDVCGERLAEEIRAVVAQHPGLARISLVSHSMGGLIRWPPWP